MSRWRLRRRVRADSPEPKEDRYDAIDLLTEATSDIGSRPGRLIVTIAGTVFGVGALVATVGLSQTSAVDVARQFDAASTAQAVVRAVATVDADGNSVALDALPWDAAERVQTLAGVAAATLLSEVPSEGIEMRAVEVHDPSAPQQSQPALVAASPAFVETTEASLVSGRLFDAGHDARADRVVLLGRRAAERFGIDDVVSRPSIFLAGRPYEVIGIFADPRYRAELLDAVVVPTGTARADFGLEQAGEVQIRLLPGGGPVVAAQAALAVAPDDPEHFEVAAPSGASELRQGVQASLNLVFLALAIVVLLAAGFGIANVTLLSVMERTGEIGLRRALGATRRQIAYQFVVESVAVGSIGGLIGSVAGIAAVIAVATTQGWAPVVDPLVATGGAFLGAVVGLVAGGLPAQRAARIEPVDALRAH